MVYEFEDRQGNRFDYEIPAASAPSVTGEFILLPDGREGKRVFSLFQWGWNSEHAPRNDEDRRLAVKMFHEPSALNPGGISDAELVRTGQAVTRDMKKSSIITGAL